MRKNRFLKNLTKGLCAVMMSAVVVAPLAACNGGKITNEGTPLTLASDALDSVFNPFFYTAAPDGDIVSQTQIGMLAGDETTGEPVAGWDQPSVVSQYSIVTTGSKDNMNGEDDYSNYYTDYYFAIKDNVQFSDGEYLTSEDVLFNLYMYLDPVYTGSNTIYSVDIQGLTAYRTQSESKEEQEATDKLFATEADARIEAILNWANDTSSTWNDSSFANFDQGKGTVKNDILKAHEFFKEELNTDWTGVEDAVKDYEKYKDKDGKFLITEGWQVFLYQYGVFNISAVRDTADNTKILYYEIPKKVGSDEYEYGYDGEKTQAKVIDYVYRSMVGDYEAATKAYKDNISAIITGYATASSLYDYVLAAVKRAALAGNMQVHSVSGIEILENQSTIPDKNGTNQALRNADGEIANYDVLHITINGVDPKAIQNFSFTVAPGHYYSNVWGQSGEGIVHGVKFSDPDFMDSVRVNQVPLGAGPYRASKNGGSSATDKIAKGDFFKDNIVYMERNDHFLLGAPKIRMLNYKVVNNNLLYDAVKNNEVHYATPNMTADTLNRKLTTVDKNILTYAHAPTLGYGYIGLSALYIPNIEIRRAIITTLDSRLCTAYYGGDEFATVLQRPMSTTLVEYYPKEAGPYTDSKGNNYTYQEDGSGVDYYLARAGAQMGSDGYQYVNGKKLKYTFTIAGNSSDHPANNMLENSAEILRKKGFDITVTHDSNALIKLSNGQLTVWAAAWSSSSDPDMYQVYHKNSTATSTRAWGYSYLTSAQCDGYQRGLVDDLSKIIEQGRESDKVSERKPYYDKALDTLMELAVEFPTYQRETFYVWRAGLFDESTMFTGNEVGTYRSPLSHIWEVSFNEG